MLKLINAVELLRPMLIINLIVKCYQSLFVYVCLDTMANIYA